ASTACRARAAVLGRGGPARSGTPGSSDSLLFREESGGSEQQNEDDDHEPDGVPVAGGDVAGAELLGDAEEEAAERGAGEVAEAAQDHDRERLERGEVGHGRGDEEDR